MINLLKATAWTFGMYFLAYIVVTIINLVNFDMKDFFALLLIILAMLPISIIKFAYDERDRQNQETEGS